MYLWFSAQSRPLEPPNASRHIHCPRPEGKGRIQNDVIARYPEKGTALANDEVVQQWMVNLRAVESF